MRRPSNASWPRARRWTGIEAKIVESAARHSRRFQDEVGRDYILANGLHFYDVWGSIFHREYGVSVEENADLGADASGQKILGRYDIPGNVAYIDSTISEDSGDPRRVFTLWHEVAGHAVLQGRWLRSQLEDRRRGATVEVTEFSISAATEQRLERYANLFASQMAAPDWLVNDAIIRVFQPVRPFLFVQSGEYWLDVRGLRIPKYVVDAGDLARLIGAKISEFFGGLSAEAIGYRVIDLGWIDDRSSGSVRLHRVARRREEPGNLLTA
jgi:hypothetical protein